MGGGFVCEDDSPSFPPRDGKGGAGAALDAPPGASAALKVGQALGREGDVLLPEQCGCFQAQGGAASGAAPPPGGTHPGETPGCGAHSGSGHGPSKGDLANLPGITERSSKTPNQDHRARSGLAWDGARSRQAAGRSGVPVHPGIPSRGLAPDGHLTDVCNRAHCGSPGSHVPGGGLASRVGRGEQLQATSPAHLSHLCPRYPLALQGCLAQSESR